MTLKEAVHDLYEQMAMPICPKWLAGIGEGKGAIHVYLVEQPWHKLPETWQGWPVEYRVTGPFGF